MKNEFLKELQRTFPHDRLKNNSITDEYLYSRYFIEKKLTTIERKSILATVSEHFDTKLYTVNPTPYLPKTINMGTVNPYTELPYVFKCSKINLVEVTKDSKCKSKSYRGNKFIMTIII